MSFEPTSSKNKKRHILNKAPEDAPSGGILGLAALSAAVLVCSVLAAKTLAYVVDRMDPPSTEAFLNVQMEAIAAPSHTKPLSDRYLRKGLDETATGSIKQLPLH